MTIDFIGKRFWFCLISGVVTLIGLASLATFGLHAGIEFSSGSILTVRFEKLLEVAQIREQVSNLGYNAIVQRTEQGEFLIRTSELSTEEKKQLEAGLAQQFGKLSETQFYSVSPIVALETARNAAIAVVIAVIGILLYVTWAFHRMPKPFRYGASAIIVLIHDTLVAIGVFAILGGVLNWQVNLMFITGILAVIGYSVNNVVVVFDRIRENLKMGVRSSFEAVVNNSMTETLGRCLNTGITTLITLLALALFVGATIQNFVVVLIVGIVAGTFSSTFIAPSLLVVWDKKEWGKFIPLWRTKA